MEIKTLLERMNIAEVNTEKVTLVNEKYNVQISNELEKIVSLLSDESQFFDDFRLLSFDEVLNASEEFGYDFGMNHMLPILEGTENDFVVYQFNPQQWAKFNLTDEVDFKFRKNLADIFD